MDKCWMGKNDQAELKKGCIDILEGLIDKIKKDSISIIDTGKNLLSENYIVDSRLYPKNIHTGIVDINFSIKLYDSNLNKD